MAKMRKLVVEMLPIFTVVFLSDEVMNAVDKNPEEAMLRKFFQGICLNNFPSNYTTSLKFGVTYSVDIINIVNDYGSSKHLSFRGIFI